MAYATRSRPLSLVFLAGCANEALSLGLKKVLRQPRPEVRCSELGTCGKFGMPSSHTQVREGFFFLLLSSFPVFLPCSVCLSIYLGRRARARERERERSFSPVSHNETEKTKQKEQSVVFALLVHLLLRRRPGISSSNPKASPPPFSPLLFSLEACALACAAAGVAWARVDLGYHSWAQVWVGAALGALAAAATAAVVARDAAAGGSAGGGKRGFKKPSLKR